MPQPHSDHSTAALTVSILSAAFTLGGLFWQLVLYRLSGARLKVQIVFCWAEDGSRFWSTTGRRLPNFSDIDLNHRPPLGIEYGRVRVTNIGRTAVSVENISFDISRRPLRVRRGRTTIQPQQFVHPNYDLDKNPLPELSDPIRLEPGDNVTAEFYLWPVLAGPDHGTRNGPILVRGSAHAVGRKRATRSKRSSGWKLPKGAWTGFRDIEVTPELRVFRELYWHHRSEQAGGSLALLMHREITKQLADGATPEDLKQYLDNLNGDRPGGWANSILTFNAHNAYHRDEPYLWTAP